jgi:hypothetical protein
LLTSREVDIDAAAGIVLLVDARLPLDDIVMMTAVE